MLFDLPAGFAHGERLADVIHVRGYPDATVSVVGEQIRVEGVAEEHRDEIQTFLDNHDPAPAPDPARDEYRASLQRLRELKAKGWANLTAAERNEVLQHVAMVMLYLRRAD